jgi:PTH1 family peptidyl-tRNA hydrolase
MALDCLSAFHKFGRSRTKFLGRTAMGALEERKLISFKPQTFMNESGRAVREASNFYKIGPERIIVFHDELDLPFGQVRVKKGGGHAGHNGLKSIDENIGTDYFRIRIGISHPGEKEKVTGHVLGDLSKEDAETLQKILTSIAENISTLIEGDEKKFQKNILQFKK